MNENVVEILTIDINYLSSGYIRKYTTADLENALGKMQPKDKKRIGCVQKELTRRIEAGKADDPEEDKGENPKPLDSNGRKGFGTREWQSFSEQWNAICKQLRGGKTNG